jgi:hypothetical protein
MAFKPSWWSTELELVLSGGCQVDYDRPVVLLDSDTWPTHGPSIACCKLQSVGSATLIATKFGSGPAATATTVALLRLAVGVKLKQHDKQTLGLV